MATRLRVSLLIAFILTVIMLTESSYAIPAFSRQFSTSSARVTSTSPSWNDFDKAFKALGSSFPRMMRPLSRSLR